MGCIWATLIIVVTLISLAFPNPAISTMLFLVLLLLICKLNIFPLSVYNMITTWTNMSYVLQSLGSYWSPSILHWSLWLQWTNLHDGNFFFIFITFNLMGLTMVQFDQTSYMYSSYKNHRVELRISIIWYYKSWFFFPKGYVIWYYRSLPWVYLLNFWQIHY